MRSTRSTGRRLLLAALSSAVVLCAGCGGDSPGVDAGVADGPAGPDAPLPPDAAPPDAVPCLAPSTDLTWLEEYQREVVGKLSGQREIFPGITITERSTSTSRTHARDYIITELARWGQAPAITPWESGANVVAVMN